MKKVLKIVFWLLLILFVFSYLNYKSNIKKPFHQGEDQSFIIKKGENLDIIAGNLKKQDLIISDDYFKIYVRLEKLDNKLQAGEYLLNPNMTIKDIAKKLSEGLSLSQEKEIKIIEGWDLSEISDYLKKEIKEEGFYDLKKKKIKDYLDLLSSDSIFNKLPGNDSLEGYFFPDTYRIFNDADLDDVVLKALNNFDYKFNSKMREDVLKQGKSIKDIVIMASIIEKEVRSEKDMKIVSGIFWNRINAGQALESCATLAYILGEDKKQYTYEDTETNSPYNTYKNRGLPPAPISNPGLKAILAAIYPEKTDYYYFLSRFDNGETVFSKTYEEHLRNKAKYLK